MINDLEAFKTIRSKVGSSQPLTPEEQQAWDYWCKNYPEAMNPEISLKDVIATLKYMAKTASFEDFYKKIKERADKMEDINPETNDENNNG